MKWNNKIIFVIVSSYHLIKTDKERTSRTCKITPNRNGYATFGPQYCHKKYNMQQIAANIYLLVNMYLLGEQSENIPFSNFAPFFRQNYKKKCFR